jgi:hypothetical protein
MNPSITHHLIQRSRVNYLDSFCQSRPVLASVTNFGGFRPSLAAGIFDSADDQGIFFVKLAETSQYY